MLERDLEEPSHTVIASGGIDSLPDGCISLFQAAASIAPRGIYVCGNSASAAGLTATVLKDPMSGSYVCEAGALVLADRGACCVDEFDKLSREHQVKRSPSTLPQPFC